MDTVNADLDTIALWVQKLRPDLERRRWGCRRCEQRAVPIERCYAVGHHDRQGRVRVAIVCSVCASEVRARSPWESSPRRVIHLPDTTAAP